MDLIKVMHSSLAAIHQPALLIHSRIDQGVNPENAQKIFDHLGSQDKEILWIEKSGHVVTRDISRQQVFEAAEAFIQSTSQQV
jgi:carboxylesterase